MVIYITPQDHGKSTLLNNSNLFDPGGFKLKNLKYKGKKYHLWNPFTKMDKVIPTLDLGPSVIVRGEGIYVFNAKDERYINGLSSLWNVALGHGRQELIDAACEQMKELPFASLFRQSHPKAIELASRLVEITDKKYQHVYLGTNGSEAVETALKIARQYHKQGEEKRNRNRTKIISLKHSYHGVSYGALSTSGLDSDIEKFGPMIPGFIQIEPPYCYRCPYGKMRYPECGLVCANALEKKIEKEEENTVAAFILEPIMGAYGIILPPDEYYSRVGEICKKHDIIFIVDEVTTGFGRTGKLFASESWDPKPDILCLGKAISSGYLPLSATLVKEKIFQRFLGEGRQFQHGSTASGHPVCSSVGIAAIDIYEKENLQENSRIIGEHLKKGLTRIGTKSNVIGDVRGRGLMLGLELVKDKESKEPMDEKKVFEYVADMASLGLLVYYTRNVIGLLPPLVIDKEIADEILDIIEKVFTEGIKSSLSRKARLARMYARSKF